MFVNDYYVLILVLEVICLLDIVIGLLVFIGGVLLIKIGGDDCIVVLFV